MEIIPSTVGTVVLDHISRDAEYYSKHFFGDDEIKVLSWDSEV